MELVEGTEGGVLTSCHGGDWDVGPSLGDAGMWGEDPLTDNGSGEDLEDGGGWLSEGGDGDALGGEDSVAISEWSGGGVEILEVEEFGTWAVAKVNEEIILRK